MDLAKALNATLEFLSYFTLEQTQPRVNERTKRLERVANVLAKVRVFAANAVVITTIRVRFDGRSTVIRLLIKGH